MGGGGVGEGGHHCRVVMSHADGGTKSPVTYQPLESHSLDWVAAHFLSVKCVTKGVDISVTFTRNSTRS